MNPEQIAKKYVHGMHDALTDNQEIKDMITDIETYAKELLEDFSDWMDENVNFDGIMQSEIDRYLKEKQNE